MIAQSTIDEIKNRIDIVEVVGDFVQLKKSGSSYKALSPFTSEKTPSFYVVPSKGIFKCFSSGKGGDAITFVQEMDGLSYLEALKYLADKYGIEVQEEAQTDEQLAKQNKRESLFIVLNYASTYFEEVLTTHEEGQSIGQTYLTERKISDESVNKFKLGYSLNQWDGLYQKALEDGYSEELLEEAGLIVRKDNEKVYDRFRGRVIFPIQNITGKVVAFGARILTNDKKQPKYLNSPETELYHKSKVLYGLYQSKQAIRQHENCFIVEGYTDVIAMHQAGVENVVSSSGTALTEDQAKLIRRYSPNVTIIFDGDAAGIRASLRGIDILLENGLNVKAIVLPDGSDPDSLSKDLGTTAFQHFLVENEQDFIQFKTSMLLDETKGDPVKKAEVIRDIVSSISKIDDAIKRSLYIKECSNLLEISESVLIVEQNKFLLTRQKEKKAEPDVMDVIPSEMPVEDEQVETLDINRIIMHQEMESIRVLLNYGDKTIKTQDGKEISLISYFIDESEELEFIHPVYNKILQKMRDVVDNGRQPDVNSLLQSDDTEIRQTVVDLMAPKYEISEFWKSKYHIHVPQEGENIKEVSFTNILRLKFWYIQHLIENKSEELKEAKPENIDTILDEISTMKSVEMQIAEILGNVTVK